jgi:nitroreductase
MNSIFHRTSVRSYKNDPVKSVDVEWMLRAAMAAPSACDQRPWEFYLVRDEKVIEELSRVSPYSGCAKGAPLVIVPCARRENLAAPAYADIDLAAACENILLEADSLGYGTVWLGIAPEEKRMADTAAILHLPDNLRPFALIPIGVPVKEQKQENRYDISRIHEI